MDDKLPITKLDGTNYSIWKFRIKWYLIHKECRRAIEPGTEVSNATDQKALAIIGLCIQDEQIVHIQHAETAKTAWDALKNVYEDAGTASKIVLQDELMTEKLQPGSSVREHIGKLRSIVAKLSTIGVTISDEQYIIILLRSLPSEYDQLVVTLENVDGLKVEDVHARLIREEVRKKVNENGTQSTALQSITPRKRYGYNRKCFFCGKSGHRIAECRKRIYHERKKDQGHNNFNQKQPQTFAMAASSNNSKSSIINWFVDSGASYHISGNMTSFVRGSMEDINPIRIMLGNGEQVEALQKGIINLRVDENKYIILHDVLYCTDMKSNLLSVLRIQEKNYKVEFENNQCKVLQNNILVLTAPRVGSSFIMKGHLQSEKDIMALQSNCNQSLQLWHDRYGHMNLNTLKNTAKKEYVEGVPKEIGNQESDEKCRGCISGKTINANFPAHNSIAAEFILDRIHSDVCGPIHPPSFGSAKYFVTFIDDWSRMLFTYIIKKKDEVPTKLQQFIQLVQNQKRMNIKRFKTDNGGEYINKSVLNITNSLGIIHEKAPPYTPQMNGISERFNRTIVEMVRTMLHHRNCPLQLWAEAVQTAVYIINRQPKRILDWKTSLELWTGTKPDVSHLRTFGCAADAYVDVKLRKKLESKVRKLLFIGYSESPRVYKLIDPRTKRIFHSAKVEFHEHEEVTWNTQTNPPSSYSDLIDLSITKPTNEEVQNVIEEQNANNGSNNSDAENGSPYTTAQQTEIRRSSRSRTAPSRLTYEHMITDDEDEDVAAMIAHDVEPISYEDAISSTDADKWKTAMQAEMDALAKNETWTLCELPPGKTCIKSKWTYRLKTDENKNSIFKARLVAKGYSQKYGVDYFETFAPVIRLETIRLLLSFSLSSRLHIHQLDCKSAFLNGDLDEELYLQQPVGFDDGTEKVCRLHKAIYGLKQAPRQWYMKLKGVLSDLGFTMSLSDNGIYVVTKSHSTLYLGLYVDDIIIATDSMSDLEEIKQSLSSKFQMKDMGGIRKFLNIEIEYNMKFGYMILSQKEAIGKLIQKFKMENCSSVQTPIVNSKELYQSSPDVLQENIPYRQLIGSLMFIMLASRPDICFSVTLLSRFLENPTPIHWKAAKRLIRYLKGTMDIGLVYRSSNIGSLTIYTDSDWANSIDRKSISGMTIYHDGNLVSWSSRKQRCITLSTCESELVALCDGLKERIWLQKLLLELGLKYTVTLCCDNQSTIRVSEQIGGHARSKHIDIKYLFIQEKLKNPDYKISYCSTDRMPADIMTKSLNLSKHLDQLDMLHLSRTNN